jgi:hypothetical protein
MRHDGESYKCGLGCLGFTILFQSLKHTRITMAPVPNGRVLFMSIPTGELNLLLIEQLMS